MDQEKLWKECLEYFRIRPVYKKLFTGMRKKYEGLGHLGGTVTLTGLSAEEKQQLGGFFQKDYAERKTVTVSWRSMEKALAESKFAGFTWEEILEAYFGEALIGKKEVKHQEKLEREAFFHDILKKEEGPGKLWVEKVLKEHNDGYSLLLQLYKENPEELRELLLKVLYGIRNLPICAEEEGKKLKTKVLLPVFAAQVTGNPHFFDAGTAGERLLSAFLEEKLGEKEELRDKEKRLQGMTAAEYKKKLFYEAGILKDELSNDVLAYGIHAWDKRGELHPGIEGFYKVQEPVRVTLQTLGGLERIEGKMGYPVYVVENPAVFSVLTEHYPDRTFVCGNGQVNLAVLILLDKLAETNIFYYAGDFDPEGLLIAQRLKVRYQEKLQFWNYHVSLYEKYKSSVELGSERMKKLERVTEQGLQELKDALVRGKRAAYQEAMMKELVGGVADKDAAGLVYERGFQD